MHSNTDYRYLPTVRQLAVPQDHEVKPFVAFAAKNFNGYKKGDFLASGNTSEEALENAKKALLEGKSIRDTIELYAQNRVPGKSSVFTYL